MKIQQTLKGKIVISSYLLLLLFGCKANNTLTQTEETYNVAKASLNYISKEYLKSRALRDYDTIVLYKEVYEYDKKKFKYSLDKWQDTNKLTKVRGFKNECADIVFKQFHFNNSFSNLDKIYRWDIKKFNTPKIITKQKSKLDLSDVRIELSTPIFNKDYTKSLILVNYKGKGKIIFYLIKQNNKWDFVCELYDIFYHG